VKAMTFDSQWNPVTFADLKALAETVGEPFPQYEWRMSRTYYDNTLRPYVEANGIVSGGVLTTLLGTRLVFDDRFQVPMMVRVDKKPEATNDPVP